ncbi:MAG TPA: hypothetical protein VG755_25065 [Nannocystaceae bacterium]|nr:hypothetical protein [Nannocystaceae bacterium]
MWLDAITMTIKLALILSLALTIPPAGSDAPQSKGKKKSATELVMPPTIPAPKLTTEAKLLQEQLRLITPLTRSKLLGLAPAVLAAKAVVEPEAYVLTPNRPVTGRASMQFYNANVEPSTDGTGSAHFESSSADAQTSWFQFGGPTRAGRGYLLDCMVTGAANYFVYGAGSALRTIPAPSDGHLTFGLRKQDTDGSFRVLIAGDRGFGVSQCEVVPVE